MKDRAEAGEVLPADVSSRKAVLSALALEQDVDWSSLRVHAVAIGAYVERRGGGRGRLGAIEEERALSHFWRVVSMYSTFVKD